MLAVSELLDAAIRVVTQDGFGALTLDAVAREAGVSKGGLTHHFATKDALITAMLEHFAQRLLRELDRFAADDPELPGRRVRAMMKVAYPELRDPEPTNGRRKKKGSVSDNRAADNRTADNRAASEVQQLFYAAIAASIVNPELLEPMRHHAGELRQRMLQQGPDGLWQVITWLALDGLMIWQMLGLMSAADPVHAEILQFLYKLSSNPPVAEACATGAAGEVQHAAP
jgi:AcrR family transcriptional regulator